MFKKINDYDQKISFYMIRYYKNHYLNELMKFISACGDFGMIWLVLILITSAYKTTHQMSIDLLFALISATFIGQMTIKTFVKRKRPCQQFENQNMLVPIPFDSSFPSSHTMSSFACATVVFLYLPIFGVFCYVFAFLTGVSRIYLFVHYLSDVIVGALLGIIVGFVCVVGF